MKKRKKATNKRITLLLILFITFATYFLNIYYSHSNQEEKKVQLPSSNLEICYLDVGQADSIFITNNGHNMMIDAGNNEDGNKIVKYLKQINIEDFDYVIGTHPHEDHIGGLDDIIAEFNIKKVILPEAYTTTKTFEDVLNVIEKKNLEITVPNIGDIYKLGEANIEVLYTEKEPKELNDASIVVNISFGKHRFLFMGDASEKVEQKILEKDVKANILKVGHHGSKYSTREDFLKKVNPEIAIISVGENNIYNHPDQSTIKKLEKNNIKIYKTNEQGTIKVTSNGKDLNITCLKTNTNG